LGLIGSGAIDRTIAARTLCKVDAMTTASVGSASSG
jgi:hypothetical protein